MADWEDTRSTSLKDNWEDGEQGGAVKDAWDEEEVEEVKDSWDADETPKSKPAAKPKPAAKAAKKEFKDMTEEEKKAAQERNDMDHTIGLFGLDKSLNELKLDSKEDIKETVRVLYAQINKWNSKDNTYYVDFLEELFKELSGPLPSESVKKLWGTLKTLGDAKFNEEKAAKPKEIKKPKVKMPKIKMEKDQVKGDFDVYLNRGGAAEEEDEDDFM